MTYLPLKLQAGSVIDGCADTSCGHWVGTPHYSGPYTLEIEHAICAWAACWATTHPWDDLADLFQQEWSGTPDKLLLERYAR